MLKDLCFEVIQILHPNLFEMVKFCKDNLEKVVVHRGKRKAPLCKQVYGFNGDLTDSDEIIR